MRKLTPAAKGYVKDGDKIITPAETVARAKEVLSRFGDGILEATRRIDTGRLGIPVYLSVCGELAREIMPTRKQMGKGASPEQSEASALMELIERYSYFHFWADSERFTTASWSDAKKRWPDTLAPLSRILQSVGESLPEDQAETIMNLVGWRFYPAMNIATGAEEMVPLDWFKKLNEFNGSSAGNGLEESILQGACELVERHVCAVIDRERPELATIDLDDVSDPVLLGLIKAFRDNGVKLWLKDFTLGMPAPTVAALAYDPASFPEESEIVFTAGTASSPVKAAIRAITEIAQLAGDFETRSNYEASGLSKYQTLDEIPWLTRGPVISLSSLPSIERSDIKEELDVLAQGLDKAGYALYSVETTHPDLGIAANYNFVPGFAFRERTPMASLGLFTGRILAEDASPAAALAGLRELADIYPNGHFLPFFEGLVALRLENYSEALDKFALAEKKQPQAEDQALAAFYQAHALSLLGRFDELAPLCDRAIEKSPDVKEYYNLRGVARFKAKEYARAAEDFESALALDSGSAMDLANLGLCHKFMDNHDQAAHFLGAALKLDPSLDFAARHLAELHE
jgi:ribosomal protein S12 methylthiotransferase accessory factor